MNNDQEKACEKELWSKFQENGVLPTREEISAAKWGQAVPINPYCNLTRLLVLESLATRGPLTLEQERQQVEAAKWCRNKLSPAKCSYENREDMLKVLETFFLASQNPALVTLTKIRAHAKLLQSLPDGPRKVKEALNGLRSLQKKKENNPAFLAYEDVFWELIGIGWSLLKDPDSSHDQELQTVLALLDARPVDPWQEETIGKLRTRIASMPARALINWSWEVRNIFKNCEANHMKCLCLAEDLSSLVTPRSWQVFLTTTDDSQLRFFLFATDRLFGTLLKDSQNLNVRNPIALLEALLGMGGSLPSSAWTRPRKDRPPEQGKPYWPANVERFSMLAYTIVKREMGSNDLFKREAVKPLIPRVIAFLQEVNEKLPDDWRDFRIGKLYLWADEREKAFHLLGPVMRKKQGEFWTWDLLSELKPEYERACLAKALLCKADEKYLTRIIRRAEEIGLNRKDKSALLEEAQKAADLLFKDLSQEKAVITVLFKNKDGHQMARLVIDSTENKEGTIQARQIPFQIREGLCVNVRLDEDGRIVQVEKREGKDWDILPRLPATYASHFRDRNGRPVHVLLVNGLEVCCFARNFPKLEEGTTCQALFKDQNAIRRLSGIATDSFSTRFPTRRPASPMRPMPFPTRPQASSLRARPHPFRNQSGQTDERPPECIEVLPGKEEAPTWLQAKRVRGVSCGHNNKHGSIRVISPDQDFSIPIELYKALDKGVFGTCIELYYSIRQTDKGIRTHVWKCSECDGRENLISTGSGTAKMKGLSPSFGKGNEVLDIHHDLRGEPFAFVRLKDRNQDVYLSHELMKTFDAPLQEGDSVCVEYAMSSRGLTAVSIARETDSSILGGRDVSKTPRGSKNLDDNR